MVDVAKISEQLYKPLLRYHQQDGSDMTDPARARANSIELGSKIATHQNVKNFVDSLGEIKGDTTKLSDAFVREWKSNPEFINQLDADLAKNPAAAQKLIKAIHQNPDRVAVTLSNYKPGSIEALIPAAPAVAAVSPSIEPAKKIVTPNAHVEHHAAKNKSPEKEKDASVKVDVRKLDPDVSGLRSHESSAQDESIGKDIAKGIFQTLADKPDDQVRNSIDANMVGAIADGIADDAVSKYGVDNATADGFKQKINDPKHPELKEAITRNLRNNPEFVRELAKASKDKTELSGSVKDMAKSTMTEFMEQPDKLADDAYVKSLTSKMKTASSFSGFGSMLSDFFGPEFGKQMQAFFSQISGAFSGIGDKAKTWFGGFQGKSVLSMSTNGNSMFPTVMINMKNFNDNMTKAQMFSRYDAGRDMTTLPVHGKDGKITHTVEVKDAQGNPVPKEVVNTVTIQDSKGRKHEVIPSVGQLMALKQADGTYDVAMVTGMDPKTGRGTDMKSINMSAQDFAAYRSDVESRSGRKYPVNEEPTLVAQQQSSIIKVEAKTGRVNDSDVQTWGLDDPKAPRGPNLKWEDMTPDGPDRAMKINL